MTYTFGNRLADFPAPYNYGHWLMRWNNAPASGTAYATLYYAPEWEWQSRAWQCLYLAKHVRWGR